MVLFWSTSDAIELPQADPNISQPVPIELIQLDGPDGPVNRGNMPLDIMDTRDFSTLRALKPNISLTPERLPVPSSFPSSTTVTTYNFYNSDADIPQEHRDEAIDFL
jgi:hypothetical protein